MYELYNEIISDKKFHLTARRGVITLLEKTGKNPLEISSWRPLTLLNTDYKIFAKIIASRMQKVLPELINEAQSGFMKGRSIADNVMKLMNVMNFCETQNKSALLVSFDFSKAFDKISWKALYLALNKFGIPDKLIDWIKILYEQPLTTVMNNGQWSQWWTPSRGCRQGCPASPLNFIILAEIIGIKIRTSYKIKGLEMFDFEVKMAQYADDLWVTLDPTETNLQNLMDEMKLFEDFSGLEINYNKTAILRLGPMRHANARFYTQKQLFWSDGPIKILGFWIFPDLEVMVKENIVSEIDKIKHIVQLWSNRALTPIGKVVVVNTLIYSRLSHKLTVIPIADKTILDRIKKLCTDYIWDNKRSSIRYSKMVQNHLEGGLKLIDLRTKEKALKIGYVRKILENKNPESYRWLYNALPIANEGIWEVNIKRSDIDRLLSKTVTLNIGHELWKNWAEYNYTAEINTVQDILNQTLILNSHIRRAGFPLSDRRMIDSSIGTVEDIYDVEEHRFKTYQEIVNEKGPVIDFLYYTAIVNAIPPLWKNILKYEHQSDYISKVEKLKNLNNPGREIYWFLIEKDFPNFDRTRKNWEDELNIKITEDNWEQMYVSIHQITTATKLRYFHYRVINRRLMTNIIRSKYEDISPLCSFCHLEAETVKHVLFECKYVKCLWTALHKWISYFFEIPVDLNYEIVILNTYMGKQKLMINFLILVLKQYIYASKCAGEKPLFNIYTNKILEWKKIEYVVACKKNMLKNHNKKWNLYQKI